MKTSLVARVGLQVGFFLFGGLICLCCLCQIALTGTGPLTFAHEEVQSHRTLERLTDELEGIPLPADTKILAAHTAYSCLPTGNHSFRILQTSQLLQSKKTKIELEAFYEPYRVELLFVDDIERDDYAARNDPLLRKYDFSDSVSVEETWVLVIRRGIYETESGYKICH